MTSKVAPPNQVILSREEMIHASSVGCVRRINSVWSGRKDRDGFKGDPWDIDVNGAMGEMAAAKFLGVYWAGAHEMGAMDILGFEVKTSPNPKARLNIRKGNRPDAKFVLVTGSMGQYIVRGWRYGHEIFQDKYLHSPDPKRKPIHGMPQEELYPMSQEF